MLYAHILLAAESAAYKTAVAVNLIGRELKHRGYTVLFVKNGLRAGIYHNSVVFGLGNGTFGFHKGVLLPRGYIFACNNVFGIFNGFIGVAPYKGGLA